MGSETTAIQTTQGAPLAAPRNVQELMVLAEQFAKSGYFKDAMQAAQAVVKIQYGRELGIGPAASMMGIHIVQGKPTLSASLIAARIKASGKYNYRILDLTNTQCVLEFLEHGQDVGTSSFTMEQAKNAGLAGKDVWKAYPQNMLFSRAISNGAKLYCADVFLGPVYTSEEMGAEVDGETGEIIEAAPIPSRFVPGPMTAVVVANEQHDNQMAINGIRREIGAEYKRLGLDTQNPAVVQFMYAVTGLGEGGKATYADYLKILSTLREITDPDHFNQTLDFLTNRPQQAPDTDPDLFAGEEAYPDQDKALGATEKRQSAKKAGGDVL